ncbi:MAG: Endo,3,4-beta-glycanase exsH [Acidimicrobiales bacterium]|nr:Endo,3,4-beta-glycanase exsH [Acidimicrobiales bacterium]
MLVPIRRIATIVVVVGLVALVSACQPPPPTPAPFAEEFNGTSLATARWHPNRWFSATCSAGATAGEQQWYRPQNVQVRGGNLVLTATAGSDRCAEGTWSGVRPYTSGWVQTGGSRTWSGTTAPGYTFRYGRVDVRFKAPKAKGLWPAIWLLAPGAPGAGGALPYPSRPEIDGLELYGQRPGEWNFNVHLATPAGPIDQGQTYRGPDWSDGFHVLSVDWRPGVIVWFVDGVPRWFYAGPGVPDVPLYLVINLAAGGWAGPVDASALPAEMLVDYVHITPRPAGP